MISAVSKYILGFTCMALLLFPAAGDWDWINGRIFMGLLFVPMLILMFFYPALNMGGCFRKQSFCKRNLPATGNIKCVCAGVFSPACGNQNCEVINNEYPCCKTR